MLVLAEWFNSDRFMPHGMCLSWDPGLLSVTAASDALIAISYFSIPSALLYFAARRADLVFKPAVYLFVVFILACGTTHLIDIWTLWDPEYGTAAMVKALTALVAVITAISLWRLMPAALALPGRQELLRANEQLATETHAHRNARIEAEELAARFEQRVRDRTADLERANAILSAVISASPLGIVALDTAGLVTIWNPAAERIHGRSAAAAVALPYPGLPGLHEGEDLDAIALAKQSGSVQLPINRHLRRRAPDGRRMNLIVSAARLHDAAGLLLSLDDVTEQSLLEAQLRQSQKMEAVGQMTGGVAHDFNNLLAVILGNLDLVMEGRIGPPEQPAVLREALDAALRGAKLTQQLMAFSRQQPLAPRAVDLHPLITNLNGLLKLTVGEQITISLRLPSDLWQARIDPNQLENVLLNLALNARDAMPEGGRLAIDAENVRVDPQPGDELAEIVPGPYVLLVVSDTGTGMSGEVRDRALEPFFTTKPVGHGSGLGLSMVYGFVKQSGGHIKLYSEPGHGTTVRLYLPRDYAAAEPAPARPDAVPAGHGEIILLVEDDRDVRRLNLRLLSDLGYRTIAAEDGPSALTLLDQTAKIDLLMTDVMLPQGMNGAVLADEVRKLRPGIKVLFISGYTRDIILHNGALDAGVHFLGKPFRKAELARKLQEVLGR